MESENLFKNPSESSEPTNSIQDSEGPCTNINTKNKIEEYIGPIMLSPKRKHNFDGHMKETISYTARDIHEGKTNNATTKLEPQRKKRKISGNAEKRSILYHCLSDETYISKAKKLNFTYNQHPQKEKDVLQSGHLCEKSTIRADENITTPCLLKGDEEVTRVCLIHPPSKSMVYTEKIKDNTLNHNNHNHYPSQSAINPSFPSKEDNSFE